MEIIKNEKKYIIADILDILVADAGEILFATPVPTEIPTDSFAADYLIEDEIFKVEKDLGLETIEQINS